MSAALRPSLPFPAPADAAAAQWREVRSLIRLGLAIVVVGVVPIGAWLALAPLTSAVVAHAYVKVDLNRRPVQHVEGGIVREVRVRDGQKVEQGETLLVLGDVAVDADMNRLDYRVQAERASIARLEAEQALAPQIAFPAALAAVTKDDPRLAELLVKERALFDARRASVVGQVELLRAQRARIAQEIQALDQQVAQARVSLGHQRDELATNRGLAKSGFVSQTRIAQIEAQVADYAVKVEERRSELARAQQRRVDTDLRVQALESEYRQQASDQLKAALARLSEIEQEERKTRDAARRQEILAPASGEVINLRFTAPGAVIPPREPIADIVPEGQRLVVEAHVRPEDINRVHADQRADIRLTAYAYRTTKLVSGKVFYVSADRLVDRESGGAYYVVNIEADTESLAEAGDLKLIAGMPAEVYITGEERTPFQYLLEPLLDIARRAARER